MADRDLRWHSILRVASPIALLAAWEAGGRLGLLDARFFPPPTGIVAALWQLGKSGELVPHLQATLWRLLAGFLVGAVPGVALGLAMGLFGWLRAVVDPIIAALYPVPKSAVLPLMLLLFGLGDGSKIAMAAIGAFFIAAVNSAEGVLAVNRIYFDVAMAFGAGRLDVVRTVALPGALPLVMAGLRLGIGMAVVLEVLAEVLGSRTGVGYVLWYSWQTFSVPRLYAMLLVTAIIGYLSLVAVDMARKRLVPWETPVDLAQNPPRG